VLERVRDAGGAVEFIDAAHLVPDHGDHHRRAMIRFDDHTHAVGQGVLLGSQRRRNRSDARPQREKRRGTQNTLNN
jgi:hypothetical protein